MADADKGHSVKRAVALICPACKGRLGDVEFTAQQQVQSYKQLLITGQRDGGLVVEGIDHSYGDPVGPLLIQCGGLPSA